MRLALLLLGCAVAAAEDRLASVAKNDVEVALIAGEADGTAIARLRNRNAHAVAVTFTVSVGVDGEPREFRAQLAPKAAVGEGAPFPLEDGIPTLRIGAVEELPLAELKGAVAGEEQELNGVTVRSWSHPDAPDWRWLAFENRNDHRVEVSYVWYLDGLPRVLTQRVAKRGWAGRHGEVALRARPPEPGEGEPNRSFDLKAVLRAP